MRYFVLCMLMFTLVGCSHSQICREETVYVSEIKFMEQAAIQQVEKLEWVLKEYCLCENGEFTMEDCRDIAQLVLTVKTRVPWHKAMMLYNAGISPDRPPETPPVILPPETLCPE